MLNCKYSQTDIKDCDPYKNTFPSLQEERGFHSTVHIEGAAAILYPEMGTTLA